MIVALLAAYLAAAPLDAPRAALLDVLAHGEDAAGCSAAQRRNLAASANIRALGRVGGDQVVLAEVFDPCICGAQNCPYYAIRLAPGKPRVLLSGFAIAVRNADHATPLPGIVSDMHDSAMIVAEDTFAYRDGKYVVVDSARVRGSDRARKPAAGVPVKFAAGASSANLHGSVALGWYDQYVFGANAGQKLTIGGVSSRSKIVLTLYGPGRGEPIPGVRAGVPLALPRSGAYRLQVDGEGENDTPYALTLTIR